MAFTTWLPLLLPVVLGAAAAALCIVLLQRLQCARICLASRDAPLARSLASSDDADNSERGAMRLNYELVFALLQ